MKNKDNSIIYNAIVILFVVSVTVLLMAWDDGLFDGVWASLVDFLNL